MQSNIEQRVMANVGAIYTVRQFVSASAIKLYVLVAALYALVQLTWVHKVFANWSQVGLGGTFNFLSHAVMHTRPEVQLTLAVILIAAALLACDLLKPVHTLRLA